MRYFTRLIDFISLGSTRPLRRLLAYYALVGLVATAIFYFVPGIDQLLAGETPVSEGGGTPSLLEDGLAGGQLQAPEANTVSRLVFAFRIAFSLISSMVLMLPVTWVYMSARNDVGYNQSIVQVLIVLPMVVAGIVLVVSNSLALAFSLAGVVAAVRFRTNLTDTRDVVFIFLAISVGFAAGVQVLLVSLVLTFIFNFVLVFIWQMDFGRSVLEPTSAAQWNAPLQNLAGTDLGGNVVPDRDLVVALTPRKAEVLAERFSRVQEILGANGGKPRFNAIVRITTEQISEAQKKTEEALDHVTKRWKLDEVVTHTNKPSQIFYLVRTRKKAPRDAMLTAIRSNCGDVIEDADVEIGDAFDREAGELRQLRKQRERGE